MGILDDVNSTRLSKQSQGCPLTLPRTLHGEARRIIVEARLWQESLQQQRYGPPTTEALGNLSSQRSPNGETGERYS